MAKTRIISTRELPPAALSAEPAREPAAPITQRIPSRELFEPRVGTRDPFQALPSVSAGQPSLTTKAWRHTALLRAPAPAAPVSDHVAAKVPLGTTTRARASDLLETTLVPRERLLARAGDVSVKGPRAVSAKVNVPKALLAPSAKRRMPSWFRVKTKTVVGLLVLVLALAAVTRALSPSPSRAAQASFPASEASPPATKPGALSRPPNRAPLAAATAAPVRDLGISLERAASDAVIEGRYQAAGGLYERLAAASPERPVFREAARILRDRQNSENRE